MKLNRLSITTHMNGSIPVPEGVFRKELRPTECGTPWHPIERTISTNGS